MEIHEKLKILFDEKKRGAKAELARLTNDKTPTISKWVSGKQQVPAPKLKVLAIIHYLMGRAG